MQDMIGETLAGRYRVEAAIGRGGMAEVYKVFDTHRAVHLAMKVLREDIAQDRVFIRRFKREAQTLAALQHPNIVRLYGLEQDDLLVFMLMDYVEGTNLRAEILRAHGPLADERMLGVMRPVCSALHYAHNQGVIHCDIKPGNIMIDQRGMVLVADFGIARAAEGATVTMVGVGTPAYMAPELVLGQAPSPQTDIYALGVVLYEMLTGGERPFTGEHARTEGTTAEKVRWEQLKLKPPSPRIYNPAIPPEVEAVVLGCLAKKPEQRFAAPLDVLNALERAMAGAEPAAPPAVEVRPAPSVEAPMMEDARPEPVADRVRLAPAPRAKEMPASPVPTSVRRGMPTWVWVGGVVVLLGVIIGGSALSGIFSHGTRRMPELTRQGDAPALTTQSASISTDKPIVASTSTSTPTAGEQARALAEAGVTRNADWTPYAEEINGVLMALVPAGCFQMGSDSGDSKERPMHQVCFEQPIWIDVYEVTQVQFAELGGEAAQASCFTGDNLPRECITWPEASAFCSKRNMRLPTEAEWEYAARGPDGLAYPWGNEFVADHVVGGGSHTWEVGSKPLGMSWIGAHDLSGNVWEWVADWYSETYYSTLTDGAVNPQGPGSGEYRVLRGGSWDIAYIDYLRASYRNRDYPGFRYLDGYGFRCALDATVTPTSASTNAFTPTSTDAFTPASTDAFTPAATAVFTPVSPVLATSAPECGRVECSSVGVNPCPAAGGSACDTCTNTFYCAGLAGPCGSDSECLGSCQSAFGASVTDAWCTPDGPSKGYCSCRMSGSY